jgi:DNA polymerase III subunit delta
VLKDEAIKALLDHALEPGLRDFNLDQQSVTQLDPEQIHSLCNTLPMLAARRVVVFREVEGWKRKSRGKAEFLRYLEQPSATTLVVLVQGSGDDTEDTELSRAAYTVRFDRLSPDRAEKWVLRRAAQLGLAIEADAARHLVRAVEANLGTLESELAKLSCLPPDQPLTPERVGELVGVRHGETLWDWRDAVLEDKPARAVGLISRVLAQPGVSAVKLVSHLGTALIGLGVARASHDKQLGGRALHDAIVRSLLRSRPFGLLGYQEEAARFSRWSSRWPQARIRAALESACETDLALKSTTVSDERGLLTNLVFQLASSAEGEGGGLRQSRSGGVRRLVTRALVLCASLCGVSALPAMSQTDPRLIDVIRAAQEGQGDSARVKVQRLLASTPPGDTLYPQILYTQAMVATSAGDMRRQLQRVAVEHSTSSWADDALLRLVQLDYASANLDGSARNLERIRRDYPGTPLLPQASYWAARTYFDQKNPVMACRWLADGVAASQGNVELQNQLEYLNQRCSQVVDTAARPPVDSATPPPVDSAAALTSNAVDTTRLGSQPDSGTAPKPEPPRATTGSSRFRVQVTAVRTAAAAEAIATKLRARGLAAVTVQEGGLYKVRVGSYVTRPEAAAAVPEIKAKVGGSPFVVAEP